MRPGCCTNPPSELLSPARAVLVLQLSCLVAEGSEAAERQVLRTAVRVQHPQQVWGQLGTSMDGLAGGWLARWK